MSQSLPSFTAGPASVRAAAYLHPGQVHASREPCTVTTILGSCVAVCVWDCMRTVGGAAHFVLPHPVGGERAARFAPVAVEVLVKRLLDLGAARAALRAKIFGGANVVAAFRDSQAELGARNIEAARRALSAEEIPIVGEDVGGRIGRKVSFVVPGGATTVELLGAK